MKTTFLLSLICIVHTFFSLKTTTIIIHVKGIENTQGKIQVGLYDNSNDFPKYGQHIEGVSVEPSTGDVYITLENIPEGEYAIAVWHDENEDKELNTNWVGKPTEKYGFSNNVFGTFAPPKFKDASFSIENNDTKKLTINLE
ncbi:DUF2141 domain-containing protein [Flammeovirga agarivorans]|uniref:DUF2141 domain-containing protein n=1 Tax=Flammeovirga agarivorans TaxID=2726742 RepID=A0A7X8SQI8_9BACT|nr:DUF2141 domain-containing protein [Flammeovirga agarivorans]NLR94510.1 DUF2141 domain-containing protein [Flammeovirga agarivorans]